MPFTTIRVIENVFTNEQKKEMLEKVTEALIDVCGEKTRQGQWVVIEEVKKGDWAIGGQIANPK
ncbi:MAG: tautomerase family protein [Polaribacter sp.]|nr:tautomerase family protein [Polaribacter sp.]